MNTAAHALPQETVQALEPRELLAAEFERRRKRNHRYSLRAFARELGLDSGYLSKVLAGKSPLTIGSAQRAATALRLTDAEAAIFLDSAADAAKRRMLSRSVERGELEVGQAEVVAVRELDADVYAMIADMRHYLILEATLLEDFVPDARWLARRLGMTVVDAEYALARLIRLGLLRLENGTLKKTDRHLTTSDKSVTTPALKESQSQILRAAQRALTNEPIETRSMTGMTMAIDPAKMPIAKRMIQTFMDQLCAYLEAGAQREVYQLSVSLFSGERNF